MRLAKSTDPFKGFDENQPRRPRKTKRQRSRAHTRARAMRGRELRLALDAATIGKKSFASPAIELACAYDGETRLGRVRVDDGDAAVGQRDDGWSTVVGSEDGAGARAGAGAGAGEVVVFRRTEGRARTLARSRARVMIEARDERGRTRARGACEAEIDRDTVDDARVVVLRTRNGTIWGEVRARVTTRGIGGEGESRRGARESPRARRTPRTKTEPTAVESDDEEFLPPFESERGPGARVGAREREFELTARVESFERVGSSATFDFRAAVAASVGMDDVLSSELGVDRARGEYFVRTAPSVRAAARPGDVVVFPSGEDSVGFACAPSALATTLSRKPALVLEVWSVLDTSKTARAIVAIDELLRRPEVRYRVEMVDDEGVVVGRVRLYIRLDARGSSNDPAPAPSTPPPPARKPTPRALSPTPVPSAQKPPAPSSKAQTRHVVAPPPSDDPRSGIEYKVAYDLEVWKQHQMTKFYEELRSKESVRMNILEDEWKRHETRRMREAEEAEHRTRILEKKLHEAAMNLELRERKLIELEENFDHRKHKLERETATAREEAKDVVRRNQEACDHRVEMEKQKAREAVRERDALHRRLEQTEAQLMEVQSAFATHKKAQLETNEATLQAEISRLIPRCEAAESQANEEAESKERYKGQLTKMARQVVALERERVHLRRAVERAGLNVPNRMQVAPSANEFMSEMLAGETGDADAFMSSFRADIAAASGPNAFAKGAFARVAPRATEPSRAPLSLRPDRTQDHDASEPPRPVEDLENRPPPPKFVPIEATLNEKRAAEKEVRRLVAERGDLMRTGMYGSGDKIIALIDERIEELTDRIASV